MENKGGSTPTKEEYANLIYKKSNSDKKRKYRKDRKLSEGILKSSFHKAKVLKNKDEASSNVRFDIKSIEEQSDYRKNHPKLDKEKIKEASTKYQVIEEADDDDYIKTLNKVNNIKTNDEIISKIIQVLNRSDGSPKKTKRHFSSENIKNNCKLNIKNLYSLTGDEQLFNNLEDEQKITLQNTLLNKFYKVVKENEGNIN